MDALGKVHLHSPVDVVRCSFLVQKSLTPLDLSILEFSSRTETIFTEEGFQKLVGVKNRRLLFEYHLDISYGLEKALKDYDPTIFEFDRTKKLKSSVYRGVKFSEDYDCLHIFWPYVMEAIGNSPNKIAKLKKLFPLMKMMRISHRCLEFYQYRDFARILQEECTDSELVAEFLEACGKETFTHSLLQDGDTEQMEYFLNHSQKMKIELIHEGDSYRCPVSISVLRGNFELAIILIKYGKIKQSLNDDDVAYHAEKLLDLSWAAMNFIQINRNSIGYEHGFGSMGRVKKWLFLLLVGVLCFRNMPEFLGSISLGVEALRLMWRSLPESYLTLSQMLFAWRPNSDINWPTADQVYTLYKTEIMDGGNQILDDVEGPRSLQHLARCQIRGRLAANCALPDGIQLLGLPQSIQGYLRLES